MTQSTLLKSLLAILGIYTVVYGADQAALQEAEHHGSSEMLGESHAEVNIVTIIADTTNSQLQLQQLCSFG